MSKVVLKLEGTPREKIHEKARLCNEVQKFRGCDNWFSHLRREVAREKTTQHTSAAEASSCPGRGPELRPSLSLPFRERVERKHP